MHVMRPEFSLNCFFPAWFVIAEIRLRQPPTHAPNFFDILFSQEPRIEISRPGTSDASERRPKINLTEGIAFLKREPRPIEEDRTRTPVFRKVCAMACQRFAQDARQTDSKARKTLSRLDELFPPQLPVPRVKRK